MRRLDFSRTPRGAKKKHKRSVEGGGRTATIGCSFSCEPSWSSQYLKKTLPGVPENLIVHGLGYLRLVSLPPDVFQAPLPRGKRISLQVESFRMKFLVFGTGFHEFGHVFHFVENVEILAIQGS